VTSVVIADSGHFVPEEQPEALATALRAFLAG
jgi:pimeloyl-ACP methyl ester carboxylesterase